MPALTKAKRENMQMQDAIDVQEPETGVTLTRREELQPVRRIGGLMRPIATPAEVLETAKEARRMIEGALDEGKDYGTVPGVDKPFLFKPGAERICGAFGAYGDPEVVEKEVDHDREIHWTKDQWAEAEPRPGNWKTLKAQGVGRNRKINGQWQWQQKQSREGVSYGLYRYVVQCRLIHREAGTVIGMGVGSCSTMENKYIEAPRNYENTVLKMAKKRALVDAVLATFGLSDQFTQDEEVAGNPGPEPSGPPPTREQDPGPDAGDPYSYDREQRQQAPQGDPATEKQIREIRRLAKNEAVTAEIRGQLERRIERGLQKREASDAIGWLTEEIEKLEATAAQEAEAESSQENEGQEGLPF